MVLTCLRAVSIGSNIRLGADLHERQPDLTLGLPALVRFIMSVIRVQRGELRFEKNLFCNTYGKHKMTWRSMGSSAYSRLSYQDPLYLKTPCKWWELGAVRT